MEKKQTPVEFFNDEILIHLNFDQRLYLKNIFNKALEMEKEINQEYYNQGVQDCKNVFEKIISDVTGNINNI